MNINGSGINTAGINSTSGAALPPLSWVHAQSSRVYALRVAASNTQGYVGRVAAQCDQPIFFAVVASSEQDYTATTFVVASSEHDYKLNLYELVSRGNSQLFSLQLIATSSQAYDRPSVFGVCDQEYSLTDNQPLLASSPQEYALLTPIRHGVQHNYGDVYFVQVAGAHKYDLLTNNPVRVGFSQFYTLLSDSYQSILPDTMEVLVGATVIEVEAISISMGEGDYLWHTEFILADPNDSHLFTTLSPFSVVVNRTSLSPETWSFVMDEKTVTRSGFGSVSVNIVGYSPAIVQGEHYADKHNYSISTVQYASAIASQIVGSIDWGTIDWLIPAFRFAMLLTIPIKALGVLVDAVGGKLESDPSGTLKVRPEFPVAIKDYPTATPAQVFSDLEDNLSSTDGGTVSSELNRFRIMESASSYSDTIEVDVYYWKELSVLLRVYPVPWRESIKVVHTDGTDINLVRLGVQSRLIKNEQIEFIKGQGTFKYYPEEFVSFEWKTTPLGGVTPFLPGSTLWTTDDKITNEGYGVALATYYCNSVDYVASSSLDIGQFLVVDEDFLI